MDLAVKDIMFHASLKLEGSFKLHGEVCVVSAVCEVDGKKTG